MPGAVLNSVAQAMLFALVAGVASLLPGGPVSAADTVQLAAEVPAGKTKTVRMRRLPRGAVISVRVRSDGNLQVALVSGAQLKTSSPQALFRGALERSLAFQVVVTEPGDYYLVLDNRRGEGPVKTQTTISAKKTPSEPSPPAGAPRTAPRGKGLDEARVLIELRARAAASRAPG